MQEPRRTHGEVSRPTDDPPNRHFWLIEFTLAEYQSVDLMVETSERTFAAAEQTAEEGHARLYQTWPGPVEIRSIRYLGER